MEFHFVMTVALPGGKVGTYSGVWAANQGESRADLYQAILKVASEQMGGKPNVMFFSLEPNELSAA